MRLLICLLIASLGTLASADPNLGLVARYRFETLEGGRLVDDSGRGNHLQAQGEVSLAPGKIGQAVRISRAGYPQAPRSESLELGGEMTLEAWIRPEFHPASGMRLLDRATIGGNDGFMFDTWPEGHLRLIIAPGLLRDPEQLPVGQWTHVAATYSAQTGEARLFRNGEIVAEGFFGGKLKPSAHPLNLGASQGGGDRFVGLMDEVRIYARALAPEEIMAHAEGREIEPPNAGRAALPPLPAFVKNGQPQVGIPALCAHNDLVYRSPAVYPFEAMHVGNGNLCASVWNAGGLTVQLNNGRWRAGNEPVSSGRVTLALPALSQPKPPVFEQRQRLYDGLVTTRSEGPAGTAEATTFVAEAEDCLVIRCRDASRSRALMTLHLWPSRTQAKFHLGPDFIALTDRAEHAETELATDLALLVQVPGAKVQTAKLDERTLQLTIEPRGPEYTIYVANPLERGSADSALQAAREMVARLAAKGEERVLAEHAAFWHGFWPRSFVHLISANGEAEFAENLWMLFHYDMACQSRQTLCPKFNGGNFLVHEDLRHWGGGYWHQNTRELFWPLYASNHAELADPFFSLYARAMSVARESGRLGLKTDGFYIPEWIPISVGPIRAAKDFSKPGYTAFIFTVGLEVALQGWWRYEFTGDERHLRDFTYPLLKGSLDFYLNYVKRGADGKFHVEPADAQESYWLVKDPAQDLAALRWAIPVALQVSRRLGVDEELRPRWQELLENLAPFAIDPEKNILKEADVKPTDERHNSENVADYAIYPFGVFGLGRPGFELAQRTFTNRPIQGMGNGWEPAAIVAARLGLADEAAALMLAHMQCNMRSNNGAWYSPTTAVFVSNIPDSPYYDAAGVSAQTLNEMLLQSQDGLIRLAPAFPAKWQGQFRLKARDGFMVSGDVDAGAVRYALIESERGGRCRILNPWPDVASVTCAGKPVLRVADRELAFDTVPGRSYLLERGTAPLAALRAETLSPAPAQGPRFIGRRLPPYPNWGNLLMLGLDEQGRSPQRATLQRTVAEAQQRIAAVAAGLTDLSTNQATVTVSRPGGQPVAAGALADGQCGGETVSIGNQQYVIVDLGRARTVQAVAFSRDRRGLFVNAAPVGYVLEGSQDGATWQVLAERSKLRAAPAGQTERFEPTPMRYLRLQVFGPYSGSSLLDEITVFGQ